MKSYHLIKHMNKDDYDDDNDDDDDDDDDDQDIGFQIRAYYILLIVYVSAKYANCLKSV